MFFYILVFLFIVYICMHILKVPSKWLAVFTSCTLPIPAFFFDPVEAELKGKHLDTFRMWNEMYYFQHNGWDWLKTYDGVILSKLYIYFFSEIDCYILLPVVTVFLAYGIVIYEIYKIGRRIRADEATIRLCILCCALSQSYVYVFTNIRMPLAVAIGAAVVVSDLFIRSNLYKKIVLMILCLLHQGAAILLLARGVARSIKISLMSILMLIVVLYTYFDTIFNYMIMADADILIGVAKKINAYDDRETEKAITRWICIYFDVFASFFIAVLYKFKNNLSENCSKFLNIIILIDILSMLEMLTMFDNGELLDRFVWIVSWLFPFIIYLSKIIAEKNKSVSPNSPFANFMISAIYYLFIIINCTYWTAYLSNIIY